MIHRPDRAHAPVTTRIALISLVAVLLCGCSTPWGRKHDEYEGVPNAVRESMEARKYPATVKQLVGFLKKEPRNARAHYLLGKTFNHLGQHDRAETALSAATVLGLQTPDMEREVGIALAGQGAYDLAIKHLRRARPDDNRAAYARAIVALKLGLEDESKSALAAATQDPEYRAHAEKLAQTAQAKRPADESQ